MKPSSRAHLLAWSLAFVAVAPPVAAWDAPGEGSGAEPGEAPPADFLQRLHPIAAGQAAAQSVVHRAAVEIAPHTPEAQAARETALMAASARLTAALHTADGFAADDESVWARRGRLSWPLPRASGVVGWGARRRADGATEERHTGWSFAATTSSEVRCAARGVVVFAGWIDGLGLSVLVAHAPDVHSVYTGLLSLTVAAGEPIDAEALVGVGAAESADGRREIYVEFRESGIPVDPDLWLRGTLEP